MKAAWKRYRVLMAAGGMALCMAAGLGIGIQCSRSHTEKMVVEAAEKEQQNEAEKGEAAKIAYPVQNEPWEDHLYKDEVMDAEIAKAVCQKYNLEYDTVTLKDVTREMRNYEEALWLLKVMGDCPLLDGNKSTENNSMSSFEGYICDIYAFGDGETVIRNKCADFGINPEQAVVSDLNIEQLIEIGEEAYETSDHPKE